MSRLPKATVIIPTLNAGPLFERVMTRLSSQDYRGYNMLIIDSSSTDDTRKIAKSHGARIEIIPQKEFTHGGTRNLAAQKASGEVLAFLSQDAVPANPQWLSRLVAPLERRKIAGVFGGQIPHPNASPMERYFYQERFPQVSKIRRLEEGRPVALDDIFFSNVNSAMKRDTLLKYPFNEKIIMSEDQDWAKRILLAGLRTQYEPQAAVIHSHDYTLKTAFQRYFDSGFSLMEITDDSFRSFTKSGLDYMMAELSYVLENEPATVPYLFLYDFSKVAGTFFGRHAKQLPNWLRKRMSMHSYHWDKDES